MWVNYILRFLKWKWVVKHKYVSQDAKLHVIKLPKINFLILCEYSITIAYILYKEKINVYEYNKCSKWLYKIWSHLFVKDKSELKKVNWIKSPTMNYNLKDISLHLI